MADSEKKDIPEQGDIFSAPENHPEGNFVSEKNVEKNSTPEAGDAESIDVETKKEEDSTSFETLLERLEEIVEKMESGGLNLEESMKLYEEGVEKAEKLTSMLSDARNRVLKLVSDSNDKTSLETFDGEETL